MHLLRVAQYIFSDKLGKAHCRTPAFSRNQVATNGDIEAQPISDIQSNAKNEQKACSTAVGQLPPFELLGNEISAETVKYLCGTRDDDLIHAYPHLLFPSILAAIYGPVMNRFLAMTSMGLPNHRDELQTFGGAGSEAVTKENTRSDTFKKSMLTLCHVGQSMLCKQQINRGLTKKQMTDARYPRDYNQ